MGDTCESPKRLIHSVRIWECLCHIWLEQDKDRARCRAFEVFASYATL